MVAVGEAGEKGSELVGGERPFVSALLGAGADKLASGRGAGDVVGELVDGRGRVCCGDVGEVAGGGPAGRAVVGRASPLVARGLRVASSHVGERAGVRGARPPCLWSACGGMARAVVRLTAPDAALEVCVGRGGVGDGEAAG